MKFQAIVSIGVLALGLAACGGGATTGAAPASMPAAAASSSAAPPNGTVATAGPTVAPSSAAATATPAGPTTQSVDGIPAVTMPLGHTGQWITDADGRVITFHGIDVAYKDPPYTPQAQGFTQADAAFLAREGFSNVRLWIFWQALEPQNGVWDDNYLGQIKEFVGWLQTYNISVRLNFAQILYCDAFGGLGLPDWTADTEGVPPTYQGGVAEDGSMPAYGLAFDNFWNNTPYPDSMGLEDHMGRAWIHVAKYFKDVPGVMGYDIMNEPNGGNLDADFEPMQLVPFYKKIVADIRTVDTAHTIDYEASLQDDLTDTGTMASAGADPNLSLTYHYYPADNASDQVVQAAAQTQMQLFAANAKTNGDAVEMTEFGAIDDLTLINDVLNAADAQKMGWLYWAFYSTEPEGNPSTPYAEAVNPQEGIVLDPTQPATGSNVKASKLAVLGRPYPLITAGTPTSWNFNTTSNVFTFAYTTAPVAGGAPLRNQLSEVVVPPRLYPNGYTASVTGGAILSGANAETLTLTPTAGSTTVALTLSPTSTPASRVRAASQRRVR